MNVDAEPIPRKLCRNLCQLIGATIIAVKNHRSQYFSSDRFFDSGRKVNCSTWIEALCLNHCKVGSIGEPLHPQCSSQG
uniref:Uncharacterized protein n=1 Tax=Ralstonia solanacearum TaxID=305 RepID=A0A0S4TST0_RALSL|nr:protein of unknown function [Ralstonia solanacearum]